MSLPLVMASESHVGRLPEVREEVKLIQIHVDLHPKTRARDGTTRARGDLMTGDDR